MSVHQSLMATYRSVQDILDDPAVLDQTVTWYSNGLRGLKHAAITCKRLPKQRSTCYHAATCEEVLSERPCDDCYSVGLLAVSGLPSMSALQQITGAVKAARAAQAHVSASTSALTMFHGYEAALQAQSGLRSIASGTQGRVSQARLTALADSLDETLAEAFAFMTSHRGSVCAAVAAASMWPADFDAVPEGIATGEELMLLGDSALSRQYRSTPYLRVILDSWLTSVTAGDTPNVRREAVHAEAVTQLHLTGLSQLQHVPAGASVPAAANLLDAAESAWRAETVRVIDVMLTRWESRREEILARDDSVLVGAAIQRLDSELARLVLLVFTTNTRAQERTVASVAVVPRFVGEWLEGLSSRTSGLPVASLQSCEIPAAFSAEVADTAISLWDPSNNYSVHFRFAAALNAAVALMA